MERRIEVQVAVSSDEHAEIIKNEIEALVRLRTTIYVVNSPMPARPPFISGIMAGGTPERGCGDGDDIPH